MSGKTQHRPHTVETTRLIVSSTDAFKFGDPPAATTSLTTLLATAGGGDASPAYATFTAVGNTTATVNPGQDTPTTIAVDEWISSSVNTTDSLTIGADSAVITYSGESDIIAKVDVLLASGSGTASDQYEFLIAVDGVTVPGSSVTQTLDAATGALINTSLTCLVQLSADSTITVRAANKTSAIGTDDITISQCTITVQKIASVEAQQ